MNVDESGYQKWVDARDRVVILPKDKVKTRGKNARVVYEEDRNAKRATLIAAVSASGTCLKPLVVNPRKSVDSG